MARATVAKRIVKMTLLMLAAGSMNSAVWAQTAPDLSGKWTLNPALSVGPQEIGFGVDWATPAPGTPGSGNSGGGGGGGGRRRGGGGGGGGGGNGRGIPGIIPTHQESEADARRLQQLTAEARNPSTHLVIVDTPTAITITGDNGQARTVHPTGQDEVLQLDNTDVSVNTRRDAGKLLVLYTVEESRLLRYTYTRVSATQLTVEVEFIGRGGGDHVKRVYEPTRPDEPKTAPAATAAAPAAPGAPGGTPANFNQQPDAEFKNLTKLGLVIEDLGQQATKCGLTQDALTASITKHLTDAGLKVQRNTDEDTYVYISIQTASLSNGYCVSRYDAYVYSHTVATLTYQSQPVLVEVSLWHKGGIAGGAPAAHADGVVRGLADYIDQFTTRIRDANKGKPAAP